MPQKKHIALFFLIILIVQCSAWNAVTSHFCWLENHSHLVGDLLPGQEEGEDSAEIDAGKEIYPYVTVLEWNSENTVLSRHFAGEQPDINLHIGFDDVQSPPPDARI